ncbi:MAG: hypothetical protein C0623_05410 [Desulfuromonas sp.]|nr:MAG: hypothetical protein C0623_05410 [Desulfuromonas sp.]
MTFCFNIIREVQQIATDRTIKHNAKSLSALILREGDCILGFFRHHFFYGSMIIGKISMTKGSTNQQESA